MSLRGYFAAFSKCALLLSLRILLLVPAGLPVRSQGDSQSDNRVMDNITVRQGETVYLRWVHAPFAWLSLPRISRYSFTQVERHSRGSVIEKKRLKVWAPPSCPRLEISGRKRRRAEWGFQRITSWKTLNPDAIHAQLWQLLTRRLDALFVIVVRRCGTKRERRGGGAGGGVGFGRVVTPSAEVCGWHTHAPEWTREGAGLSRNSTGWEIVSVVTFPLLRALRGLLDTRGFMLLSRAVVKWNNIKKNKEGRQLWLHGDEMEGCVQSWRCSTGCTWARFQFYIWEHHIVPLNNVL